MHEKILEMLMDKDEITWQALLVETVRSENMDPWDIDISTLTKNYIAIVKKLKKTDLRVSGKVVLAASILLRIKATRLLNDDISQFDSLLAGTDEDDLYADDETEPVHFDKSKYKHLKLIPKTPQPRKRKVSIYDLMEALEVALEIEKKRKLRIPKAVKVELPEKKWDLSDVMTKIYINILGWFKKDNERRITFSQLVPEDTKTAKVRTFIPLLHLTNQRKIDLEQEIPFSDFDVKLIKENIDKEIEKELEV